MEDDASSAFLVGFFLRCQNSCHSFISILERDETAMKNKVLELSFPREKVLQRVRP